MAQIVKLRRSAVAGKKPTNSQLELGELSINTTDGKVYFAKSGSQGPSIEELVSTNTVNTGSIFLTGNVSASFFTGSFIGDGSGLYNIPASGVTGLQLDRITDGNATASISEVNGFFVNTHSAISGSLNVSGSLILSGSLIDFSGSAGQQNYFLTSDGEHVYWALNESGAGKAYFKSEHFTTSTTWSFVHNLKEKYPIVNVYDEDGNQLIPTSITAIDENTTEIIFTYEQAGYASATIGGLFNTFSITNPSTGWTINHYFGEDNPLVQVYDNNDNVILPNEIESINNSVSTLTVLFGSSSISGKISVAGSGTSYKKTFETPSDTWTITHNLNELYPIVQVYNIDDQVIIPQNIISIDENTIVVSFAFNTTGTAHITVGGANTTPTIDNNYDGYVLATDGNSTYWKGGILSGSLGLINLGFATTGSNTFTGDQIFNGSIIPSGSNLFNLGSPEFPWQHLYLSTGSIKFLNAQGLEVDRITVTPSNGDINFVKTSGLTTNQINQIESGSIPSSSLADVNVKNLKSTGVISGDGSGIYNIPASGVTGLQLNQLTSGSLYASLSNNKFNVNTSVLLQNTTDNVQSSQGIVAQSVSGSVTLIDLNGYNSANFDYMVKNGLNMRAGNIAAAWNGSQSSHNEMNTTDLGNTSQVTFDVTNNGKLNVSVSSGVWVVQINYRTLGNIT